MQRTIPLTIEDDEDLRATLESYRIIQQSVSEIAFKLGRNFSAITLHRKSYSKVRGNLKAQLTCTAIRSVAAAYANCSEKLSSPILFNATRAMFLIGTAKRDAGLNRDGTISIWTIGGRKKLKFTIPESFKNIIMMAVSFDAICVAMRGGRLHATISVSIDDPKIVGNLPIGIDINESNAIAAVDICGRSMCVTGVAHRVMMKTEEKTRRRLEERLATRKAENLETRSVRRVLKRLSRRRYLQTKTFCNTAAKRLIQWSGANTILVMEDFRRTAPSRRRKIAAQLGPPFYEILRRRIEEKAAFVGIPVAYIEPVRSKLICSRCGSTGLCKREQFSCESCGLTTALDKNAALSIRNRFTVFKAVGCGQPAPKLDIG